MLVLQEKGPPLRMSSEVTVGPGFTNEYQNCFVNAVLQLLVHLRPLLQWCKDNWHHRYAAARSGSRGGGIV